MSVADIRYDVLEIVNRVEEKLAINRSSSLTSTKFTRVLLQNLNDVVADLTDYGSWQELFGEVEVTAQSSVGAYAIDPGELVQNVFEIAFEGRIAPMIQVSQSDILRLQRVGSHGVPNQFRLIGVDASANPVFRCYPIPGPQEDGKTFHVSYYRKQSLYTTADAATIPPFPGDLLVLGVHARALLEESGGQQTQQFQAAQALYEASRTNSINRYNADTGPVTTIKPRPRMR